MAHAAHTPEANKRRYDTIATRDELYGFWSSVVFDEREATNNRSAAAEKLHDRVYGGPLRADSGDRGGEITVTIKGGFKDV
jgi:hypothetical protein